MRFLCVTAVAILTAVVGCVLGAIVGDYLTRLAQVTEMEGQRGMMVIFVCAPLGILVGLISGAAAALLNRRPGFAGFLRAQGWALLTVLLLAGLLFGIPYLLSDKPPRLGGKQLELQFELRAPATIQIPDQPDGYSIRVSLYTDNRQSRFGFIDWQSIRRESGHVIIPGRLPLLTHSRSRSLLASIGDAVEASQFLELKLPPAPGEQDKEWSDWITATQRADLSPVPESERFAVRYRVQPMTN